MGSFEIPKQKPLPHPSAEIKDGIEEYYTHARTDDEQQSTEDEKLHEQNTGIQNQTKNENEYDDYYDEFYDPYGDPDRFNKEAEALLDSLPSDLAQKIEYINSNYSTRDILDGRIPPENLLAFIQDIAETGKIEYIIDPSKLYLLMSVLFQDDSLMPRSRVDMIESLVLHTHPNVLQAFAHEIMEEALENARQKYFVAGAALLECYRIISATFYHSRFSSNASFGAAFWINSDVRTYASLPESNYLLSLRMRCIADEKIPLTEDSSGYGIDYDFSHDYKAFRISKDRYARWNESDGRLYIARPEDFSSIHAFETGTQEEKKEILQSGKQFLFYPFQPKDIVTNEKRAPNRYSEDFQSYLMLAREQTQDFIQKDFGCDIRDLTFAEQNYFLQYLRTQTNAEAAILQSHAKNFGINFVRSFLSLEQGGEKMGETILAIGENLPPETADAIFAKYVELVNAAHEVERYLLENVSEKKRSAAKPSDISEKLLIKAKDILVRFSGTISENTQQGETILEELRQTRADIELYKTVFESLERENADFSFDDLLNTAFETGVSFCDITSLPEQTRNQKEYDKSILRENYAQTLKKSPEKVRAKLLDKFDRHTEDPHSHFSLFRHEGKVQGSMCFSRIPAALSNSERSAEFVSAVNMHPSYQGSSIGWKMIEESFNEEARNNILLADCVPQKNISARYIESGFVGYRIWNDDGEEVLDIVRDDTKKSAFPSKSLSKEAIIRMHEAENAPNTWSIQASSTPQEIDFSLCSQGYVLTRYFRDISTKRWYTVFEKTTAHFPQKSVG